MRTIYVALLTAYAVALIVIQALSVHVTGSVPEFQFHRLDATRRVVSAVSPEAASDGLRNGDVYDWTTASTAERRARFRDVAPGEAFDLPVVRDGRAAPVRLIARPRAVRDQLAQYGDILFKMLALGIGIVLASRGNGTFGLFSGLALCGYAAFEGFGVSYAILGWPLRVVASGSFAIVAYVLLYFQVEAMLTLCGSALTKPERWFFRAAGAASTAVIVFGTLDHVFAALTSSTRDVTSAVLFGAQLLLLVPLFGYAIALLRLPTRDREIVRWVFWTSVVGISGPMINLVLAILEQPIPSYGALNLTLFVMAFGYAYVALRYRVVDLSFVANRAVVYATIFVAVVAVFTIAETIITKFAVSRVDSIAVDVVFSLAVALSIKPVERRVDAFVERFLFAAKHATEQGLRALIRDCPLIEDPKRLLQNVCDETRRLTGAQGVVAYERLGNILVPGAASPADTTLLPVSIDDPVVVRMRSCLEPVDLGELPSSLGNAGTVFPMLSRGRMLGVLVCGDKPGRRAYDPDERELLAEVAHEAGSSLLFLRTAAGSAGAKSVASAPSSVGARLEG